MKKIVASLILLSTAIIEASNFTIPIINTTIHPVMVTIISHAKEISSVEVAPTIKKAQQFCTGLTCNSIKYIIVQHPAENLPQIIRYPYAYRAEITCTKCHTQNNARTSWCDIIGTALHEGYLSGNSVSSTTQEVLKNNIIINKKNISMALDGIFRSMNYDKAIAHIEKNLSSDIKKINQSVQTISMMLEDLNIMKSLNISNFLIKKLETKIIDISKKLSTLSLLLNSLQNDIMNIDMITALIKKKNYDQNDLIIWKNSLTDIMKNVHSAKESPVARTKSISQKIKCLESKYKNIALKISNLLL